MTRQVASYRDRRVLLAGDPHVHSPVGGQGLNTGVQDAVHLGWKLAQVVRGKSPESLLDTYQAERHPVAARVLQTTLAQTALSRSRPGHRSRPLRVFTLLHDAWPVLLNLGEPGRFDITPWADRFS